ncbi:MAG: chorismate synthase [Rikenellaceae bacterium]|jgi:chorismate synthase|nr:chorismate synthase [Bacteroidales bacterium]
MNSFGRNFRISIFGESHGEKIGLILDGIPAGISLSSDDFLEDLARRSGGKPGTTPRIEKDIPEIVSGVYKGFTTGAPIGILFSNDNTRSSDYLNFADIPRPGHADFVSVIKSGGYVDLRGGGHHSGRITLTLVAAGVVAKKILGKILVKADLIKVGGVEDIEDRESLLQKTREEGDSLGGIIECTVTNMPVGLGEPFFDSLESLLSHIIFAIPGIRGIEFGDGFAAAFMRGSEHNDPIVDSKGKTSKNGAGGINGGISNGNDLLFRVAVKPTSSISKSQQTLNFATGNIEELKIEGRHDTCFALRVPVVVEAATAIVLADLILSSTL